MQKNYFLKTKLKINNNVKVLKLSILLIQNAIVVTTALTHYHSDIARYRKYYTIRCHSVTKTFQEAKHIWCNLRFYTKINF